MKSKRGSLSLSITAIVVIVIAFVVLGLGLSLTRTIFQGAEDKLPEAFAVTQLEAQPTSQNPITLSQTVNIDRQKSKTMKIGFYNKGEEKITGAKFTIEKCLKSGGDPVETSQLPKIASPSEDVGPSSSVGYSIIINEEGLPADTYICTIGIVDGSSQFHEKKQFFLKVIA